MISQCNQRLFLLSQLKHQGLSVEAMSVIFTARRRYTARTSYGNVAGWVAGWVGVCHSRYCIKTTKPILKLFRPSGSPSFQHLGPLKSIPNSKGNPFIGGYIYTGGRKNWRFSTEIAVYLGNGAR